MPSSRHTGSFFQPFSESALFNSTTRSAGSPPKKLKMDLHKVRSDEKFFPPVSLKEIKFSILQKYISRTMHEQNNTCAEQYMCSLTENFTLPVSVYILMRLQESIRQALQYQYLIWKVNWKTRCQRNKTLHAIIIILV